jgi:hypothetical protein
VGPRTATLPRVRHDHELIDVVCIEVPTFAMAKALLARLRPVWCGQIDDLGHAWAVLAEFRGDARDLAVLLRVVESWLELSGLGALRFRLDGRDYLLEAADPVEAVVPT